MNNSPKEIDWSQAKPGTKGVMRNGTEVEFLAVRQNTAAFVTDKIFEFRNTNGRAYEEYGKVPKADKCDCDILLPWKSCIAEGHNPDKLTNEQVGDGYRLIQNYTEPADPRAEYYNHDKRVWSKREDQSPYIYGGTYRVPIANPNRRVPCGPEHFPPGTVLRIAVHEDHTWSIVVSVDPYGVVCMSGHVPFAKLDGLLRSIDGGKTWLPCYVELKE